MASPSVHASVPPSRRTEAERRHEIATSWTRAATTAQASPLEITARTAKPVLRAPSGSRLPVPPLFASSAALRILPLGRGRLCGRRRHRRFPDPPKRHPCSRALQALWCEPDHACAPVRRANACGSASRTFSKTSRPAAASRFARSDEASWANARPPRRNASQPLPRRRRHITAHCHPAGRSHEHRGRWVARNSGFIVA